MRQRFEHKIAGCKWEELESTLESAEKDGWELVSTVFQQSSLWFGLFFKRPVRPSQLRRKGENNATTI